jgi:hypothetical protein
MEPVGVLVGSKPGGDSVGVEVAGKGKLDQDAVDLGVGVETIYECFDLSLCNGGGQFVVKGPNPNLAGGPSFVAHVNAGSEVVPD